MPTDPTSVRWTLHALDKAQQLGFTRRDVESALLEGHREWRRNKGQARWLLASGRLVIAYEYPDGEDLLAARIVTRELDPTTGAIVGLEFWEASSKLPADFLRMLPPPQVEIAA